MLRATIAEHGEGQKGAAVLENASPEHRGGCERSAVLRATLAEHGEAKRSQERLGKESRCSESLPLSTKAAEKGAPCSKVPSMSTVKTGKKLQCSKVQSRSTGRDGKGPPA